MSETTKPLAERLLTVQQELKVPKAQNNDFGHYKYRNAEDILEAVKPLLLQEGLTLTLSDELVQIGERYYIKATAALGCHMAGTIVTVSGYAREEETKKGMDGSQITGASSSYARKYALNGLFLIDDTKDSDATNDHDHKVTATEAAVSKVYRTPEKPAEPRTEPSSALIRPYLMTELRNALKASNLTGTKATEFVRMSLGYDAPNTEDDVKTLLQALKSAKEIEEQLKLEEPFE